MTRGDNTTGLTHPQHTPNKHHNPQPHKGITMSRTGHRTYRTKRARIKRTQDTCALCGQHIDPTLTYPHPMSFSADHITPVGNGGSNLGPLQATHLRCNISRGKKDIKRADTHLRDW